MSHINLHRRNHLRLKDVLPPLSTSTSSTPGDNQSTSTSVPLIFSVPPTIVPLPPGSTTSSSVPPSSALASTRTFVQTIANLPGVNETSSVTPTPTTSATPVGGASAGVIAGGILAAILGAAGILAAVVYFLRKCRRSEDEAFSEAVWNREDARRRSAILTDDLVPVRSYDGMGPGLPRPPTMIERHLNNTPSMPYRQPALPTFSSTVPDYHNQAQSASPAFSPQALTRQPLNGMGVTRQNSINGGPFSPVISSPEVTDVHYVDLSRSSVTPFQAAQYAEITEKLTTPVTSVLYPVPEHPQGVAPNNRSLTSYADFPPEIESPTGLPFVDSSAELSPAATLHDLDTELPTPDVLQHTRVPSTPPTLPEINVPERSFSPVVSLDFPVPRSAHASPSPLSAEFTELRTPPPTGLKYKNSPLGTSSPVQTQPAFVAREPKTEAEPAKRPDTVYTVYDEEDAYGGF
ncbi:hypothetical protein B0F90DRAFT_1751197 [Multifurca ochricompacta]|uniref:Uncharacterized protein n=1 Tax=Multifurca ochricompacta TaxID=376703 RepID=A0AAD4QL24_9AGAM|nr:hypothetical protein B0F90DRAFT_1751197 [Multifurca ochricompacta]